MCPIQGNLSTPRGKYFKVKTTYLVALRLPDASRLGLLLLAGEKTSLLTDELDFLF